jgi:hypothetical protein
MALTLNLLVAFCLSYEQTQALVNCGAVHAVLLGWREIVEPIPHDQAFKWQ